MRAGPDGVAAPADAVLSCDGRAEVVPDGVERMIVAAIPADAFELALLQVAFADGQWRSARTHLGLPFEAKHGERAAFGALAVESAAIAGVKRSGERASLAGP